MLEYWDYFILKILQRVRFLNSQFAQLPGIHSPRQLKSREPARVTNF